MGSRYNKLMDNSAVRVAINVAGFVVWLAVSYALLKI
jgi:hypothetical protein